MIFDWLKKKPLITQELLDKNNWKWIPKGRKNTFGVPLVNITSFTHHHSSAAMDNGVVQTFIRLRDSDGRDLKNFKMESPVTLKKNLKSASLLPFLLIFLVKTRYTTYANPRDTTIVYPIQDGSS